MPELPAATPPPVKLRPLVRRARLVLYALLVLSAAVTLFGLGPLEQGVREGRWPPTVLMLPPALLACFILLFAVYRFTLVRAGRYLAGKAFIQVGLMVLVLMLLLPKNVRQWQAAGTVRRLDLQQLLEDRDAEKRALAAELTRHRDRPEALRYVPPLLRLLDDPSPEVRRQARASLTTLAGGDRGGEGPEAARRWRDYWQAAGVDVR